MNNNSFEQSIQALDNDPEILQFIYADGTSIWPSLRFQLRVAFMEQEAAKHVTTEKRHPKIQNKNRFAFIKYLWHCLRQAPFFGYKNTDVLSIANYEGNPGCPNRMTVFLKSLPELRHRELLYSPRWVTFSGIRNTGSFDYFFFRTLLEAKIRRSGAQNISSGKDEILYGKLREKLGVFMKDGTLRGILNTARNTDKYTRIYRRNIHAFLSKNRPGMIVCSEGNNGDWRHAILFSVARELGIPTAEVQHGVFNLGMKFGSEIVKKPEFIAQKSTHLFTFGPFHCKQTNLPAVCVPLGHYHMEQQAGKWPLRVRKPGDPLELLFICEGNPPSSVNNGLIRVVREALQELEQPFNLTIRLHPSETEDSKYSEFFKFPGTRYSNFREDHIHKLICASDGIVSHASTVVFEAIYFRKPALVLEDEATSQYIPEGTGIRFRTSGDLLELLRSLYLGKLHVQEQTDTYWAEGNVCQNFMNFWKEFKRPNPEA